MANQEQIIDQTEAPAEVVDGEPATEAQEQPLNAFYVPSVIGTCCRFGGFNSAEMCAHELPHQIMEQAPDCTSPAEREALAIDNLNRNLRAVAALIEQNEVQAPNAEPTSVQQKGKNVNQKKRQAPPRVGKRLIATVERKTEYGIIVRQGKFRAHLDFQYMALSDEGTAIRFQPGDKVECRVLSLELKGGLPRVTMLGEMLPPVKRPATAIQAEVVSLLVGHAVFDQLRTDLPSAEAMELHEGFAYGVAEAVAQSVEPATEAPAEVVEAATVD